MGENLEQYTDEYSEQFRKHAVSTKYKVCLELRHILKQIGLSNLLKNGDVDKTELIHGAITALSEANLVNEFCQIVTERKDVDYNECEFGEIAWIIHDFFVGYWWQMPPSWRAGLKKSIAVLQEMGKAFLPVATKQEQ